ncbi:MAG: glycosyltransferase [archaeon]
MTYVTIGVPVHNEETTLRQSLDTIIASASRISSPCDILLCFNGTTDNGRSIAEHYADTIPFLKIIESAHGKPAAINAIVQSSPADTFIFTDADALVEKDCFSRLLETYTPSIQAVTGTPLPYEHESFLYKVINARMLHPGIEIAKHGNKKQKPFLHGRIYSVRKEVFTTLAPTFPGALGDDTFLSHHILQQYGPTAIAARLDANVHYQAVRSIRSWWHKWSRIWSDLDQLYANNPEFLPLREVMKTKLDWAGIPPKDIPYFLLERTLYHGARAYFLIMRHVHEYSWKRLDDTKRLKT